MLDDSDSSQTNNDTDLDAEEGVDEEREPCALQTSSPSKLRKAFSDEQVTCLCDHYKRGMIGVGRKYSALIEAAGKETGLTIKQVKGWIKRTLFRKRHAEPIISKESLPTKKFKRTPWQQFQSEFAATDEGKKAFSESPATFMKEASNAYKSLESGERNRLQASTSLREKPMSSKDVRREGGRIFQSMQKKFQELEELGYHAFAFGIYGDSMELVGTPSALKCCTSQILQYLSAVLIAGNPPIIGNNLTTSSASSGSQVQAQKGSTKKKKLESKTSTSAPSECQTQATTRKKTFGSAKDQQPKPSITSASTSWAQATKGSTRKKRLGSAEDQQSKPSMASTSVPSKSHTCAPKGSKKKMIGSTDNRQSNPSIIMSDPASTIVSSESQAQAPQGSTKMTLRSLTSSSAPSQSRAQAPKGSNKSAKMVRSTKDQQSTDSLQTNAIPDDSQYPITSAEDRPMKAAAASSKSKYTTKSKAQLPNTRSLSDTSARTKNVPTFQNGSSTAIAASKPKMSAECPTSLSNDPLLTTSLNPNESLAIEGSSSPITLDTNIECMLNNPEDTWIKEPYLTLHDKRSVERPHEWLNDAVIHAAQVLLKRQSGGMGGFQSPQYGKGYRFKHEEGDFVQVLHVSNTHWITISNIGCSSNAVNVFDSAYAFIDMDGKKQVCSIMKPTGDILAMDFVNIQHQGNSSDCGLFALACATDLVHNRDPFLSYWNTQEMRSHLVKCLEAKQMTCFPLGKARRIPLRNRLKKTIKVNVHCTCRMPYGRADQGMVCCDVCCKWFHCTCMQIEEGVSLSDIHWECNQNTCKPKVRKSQR